MEFICINFGGLPTNNVSDAVCRDVDRKHVGVTTGDEDVNGKGEEETGNGIITRSIPRRRRPFWRIRSYGI